MKNIRENLEDAKEILEQFISYESNIESIKKAGDLIASALKKKKKVISFGNGGSLNDAMHFAEELTGKFRKVRAPLPAIAISDPSYLSCVANDFGYEYTFSRFIEGNGIKGDIALAISTSGNSENIIKAVETARKKGISVIGLTGKDGGKLSGLCDIEIRAPYSEYSDRAQEIHIKVIHCLIDYIEQKL